MQINNTEMPNFWKILFYFDSMKRHRHHDWNERYTFKNKDGKLGWKSNSRSVSCYNISPIYCSLSSPSYFLYSLNYRKSYTYTSYPSTVPIYSLLCCCCCCCFLLTHCSSFGCRYFFQTCRLRPLTTLYPRPIDFPIAWLLPNKFKTMLLLCSLKSKLSVSQYVLGCNLYFLSFCSIDIFND